MNSSFLLEDRPTLVAMMKSQKTSDLLSEIKNALSQGADAFGIQLESLVPEEKNAENYRRILDAMGGKPAYVTNYIRGNHLDLSDDELINQLFDIARCGAKLIDIRCDSFDRQPDEYTEDVIAAQKQSDVIKAMKEIGVDILVSSHIFRFVPYEDVRKIAQLQKERGADIVKIVTEANSYEDLVENFRISMLLRQEFGKSLFLCNGTHCKRHRILDPLVGPGMFLVVEDSNAGGNQPGITQAKEALRMAGYDI